MECDCQNIKHVSSFVLQNSNLNQILIQIENQGVGPAQVSFSTLLTSGQSCLRPPILCTPQSQGFLQK